LDFVDAFALAFFLIAAPAPVAAFDLARICVFFPVFVLVLAFVFAFAFAFDFDLGFTLDDALTCPGALGFGLARVPPCARFLAAWRFAAKGTVAPAPSRMLCMRAKTSSSGPSPLITCSIDTPVAPAPRVERAAPVAVPVAPTSPPSPSAPPAAAATVPRPAEPAARPTPRPAGAPDVRVSVLIYSRTPARRSVARSIDGAGLVTLREGQTAHGLEVVEILPDGAQLAWEGARFTVPARN
jgi:hypothetical protein